MATHLERAAGALTYQRVSSSCIAEVGYDRSDKTLAVRFRTGSEYWYTGIPPEIYQGLLTAASVGRYFNTEIRDAYPHQRCPAHPKPHASGHDARAATSSCLSA